MYRISVGKSANLLAFIIPIILFLIAPLSVTDLAGWVAYGQAMFKQGILLSHDPFSPLGTTPIVHSSWLLSLGYALLYPLIGLEGIAFLHALATVPLLKILYDHSVGDLKNPWLIRNRLWSYASWVGMSYLMSPRPAFLALLPLSAAYCHISRRNYFVVKDLLILSLIEIVWANLHGSFPLLPLMLGWKLFSQDILLSLRQRRVPLNLVLKHFCQVGLVASASIINPFGFSIWTFVWQTASLGSSYGIAEWAPTITSQISFLVVIYFALFASCVFFLFKCSAENRERLLTSPFMILLALGLTSIRNAILPFVVLLPACREAGVLILDGQENKMRSRPVKGMVQVLLFVFLLLLSVPWIKLKFAWCLPEKARAVFDVSEIPQIASRLRQMPSTCNVLSDLELSSYLLLNQNLPLIVHFNLSAFHPKDFLEYKLVLEGRASHDFEYLKEKHICYIVLNRQKQSAFFKKLLNSGRWVVAATEKGATLLESTR